MKKCKECGRYEWGYLSALNDDGYCPTCAKGHYKEKIKDLELKIAILEEQRDDVYVDREVLKEQLEEANQIIYSLKDAKSKAVNDYIKRWLK